MARIEFELTDSCASILRASVIAPALERGADACFGGNHMPSDFIQGVSG
jgi:hypothetical protein